MSAVQDERVTFIVIMRRRGVPMPSARVLDLKPPLADDGETDCWTHAYRHARETGAEYVEGICYLPPREDGQARVAAHAWCLEQTPLGPVVREFTPGYEEAFAYRGLGVDLDSREATRAEVDGRRYSVIELDIAVAAQGD